MSLNKQMAAGMNIAITYVKAVSLIFFQETIPVAWVNTTLFDYQGKLRQGPLKLFAWPVPETMADQLNPVGTVVSNIDTVTSVSLDIAFSTYSDPVLYPSFDQVRGGT